MDGGEKNPVAATSSGCLARAVTLHLAGKREEALKQLQRTVDVGEASPEIYRAMGHIQFELDAFADAAASYRSLTGIKPQYAKGWFNLAVCLERLDDWDGASQAFHKASTLDPSHLEAHLGLGVSHLRLEDPKSALFASIAAWNWFPITPTRSSEKPRPSNRWAIRTRLRRSISAFSNTTRSRRNRSPTWC
jgi:Flp pilus assembly protein TadD